MRVIEADAMGICFGVRDALATMRALEQPAQVTVFGQLVHNPVVLDEMERRGYVRVEEAEQRAAESVATRRVLITAHGVSDRERAVLAAGGRGGREFIDTTCPLVRKAHQAAVALARAGFFVVVIGKPGHVEVRGLTGDLPEGSFAVVETQMGVRCYGAARIGVMAQTTMVEREARGIVERVREMNPPPGAEVRFVNTICMPTRERQAALERLLTQVDVLVVVGGRESNNTRQLAGRAREAGVRAVHVEEAGELTPEMFGPEEIVGLTAGTSTLPETVAGVKERLAAIEFYHEDTKTRRIFTTETRRHGGRTETAVRNLRFEI